MSLQAYGGAIADVPDSASAFSHRDTAFEYVTSTSWTDPAEDQARMAAARERAMAIAPFASGVYVNMLSDEGAEGLRRAYPRQAGPARRGEKRLRPRQRLPPQPEHLTRRPEHVQAQQTAAPDRPSGNVGRSPRPPMTATRQTLRSCVLHDRTGTL